MLAWGEILIAVVNDSKCCYRNLYRFADTLLFDLSEMDYSMQVLQKL
jgi:hypothetical protein